MNTAPKTHSIVTLEPNGCPMTYHYRHHPSDRGPDYPTLDTPAGLVTAPLTRNDRMPPHAATYEESMAAAKKVRVAQLEAELVAATMGVRTAAARNWITAYAILDPVVTETFQLAGEDAWVAAELKAGRSGIAEDREAADMWRSKLDALKAAQTV